MLRCVLRTVAFAVLFLASFPLFAAAPTATTAAASSITTSSATLNGAGVPNGEATTGWFRISPTNPGVCDDTFGNRVPTAGGTLLGAGTSSVPYSINATGLTSGVTYYFCAIVSNGSGLAFGSVLSFTVPGTPTVSTTGTMNVTSTSATLEGAANPNAAATTGWFRYSLSDPGSCDDTFGTRAPTSSGSSLGAGSSPVSYTRAIAGLSPGATYYYCAIAQNAYGTSFGPVLSFTALAEAPTVSTSNATLVTGSTAQLNGAANPGGDATTGWFRYSTINPGSCNDTFGTRAPTSGGSLLGSGNTSVAYALGITGLSSATTYYFCAIAQNSVGTSFGAVLAFTTPSPPTVVTTAATNISSTGARLNGLGTANGATTTGWFRYSASDPVSCDDTFGSRAPTSGGNSLGSGSSALSYFQNISGLSVGTTYYYCAIASNSEGLQFGAVLSFTTAAAPTVTTDPATLITATTATLNGAANPNSNSAYGFFRYSTSNPVSCNDSFGTRIPSSISSDPFLGSGTSSVGYALSIGGLSPATTYYYCALGRNTYGTSFGAVMSFTTAAALPSVSTNSAINLTGTTAELRGSANPGGAATNGWFRYATTSPGTCNDSFGTRAPTAGGSALGSGNGSVAFNESISGLTAGTTYYFCAIAENSVGKSFGGIQSFVAPLPPTVATAAATNVSNSSARFNGSGVANGSATIGWFRYSITDPVTCNDTFGSRAPATGGSSLGSSYSTVNYNQTVSGLSAGTTYYYCAIASSAEGIAFGAVFTATTADAPTVTTAAATLVTPTTATLNGSANPNNNSAYGFFRYSTTNPVTCNDSFGTRIPSSSGADTWLNAGDTSVGYAFSIGGLSPGNTYYYCALARNSYGTSFGTVLSFSTPAALPSVATNSAINLTGATAQLRGTANPGGDATSAWFRYATTSPGSCNDTFGTRAPTAGGSALGSGNSSVTFNESIAGLSPATTYFFCAIAENAVGKAFGSVLSFTTPTPPTVTTNAATNISNSSVRLQGSGNPNGSTATGWFRYSLTDPGSCDDTFGSRAPTSGGNSLGSGNSPLNYNQTVSGLSAGTTYYYCAIASSSEGIAFGAVLSVKTADAPSVTTAAATLVTATSATFNGAANPNSNSAFGFFRYSNTNPVTCNDSFGTRAPTSVSFDTSLSAGDTSVAYALSVGGLTPGATYYYCALGRNSYGTSFGTVLSFTTAAALPGVSTNSAINLTGTTADLRGSANPGGAATSGWFRYATASPGTCNDSFGTRAPTTGGSPLGAGNSTVAFSETISGLTAGTTYYFCAIGENAVGKAFGGMQSFVAPLPPTVATTAATNISNSSARFNGSGVANGSATTGWFRYSTTDPVACNDTFGSRAPATGGSSLGSSYSTVNYNQTVSGLSAGTTYFYCAIASSAEGMAFGAVLTVTTADAPTVTTLAATSITPSSATLNGSATPNNNGSYGFFRYSTTDPGSCSDSFGTRLPSSSGSDTYLGADDNSAPYGYSFGGLLPGNTYYYCALSRNSYGTSFGAVLSFTTPAALPSVSTNSAINLTGTTAQLRGTANPGGAATDGWFRYATTSPGSCNDTFGTRAPTAGGSALGSGNSSVAFNENIAALTAGTTYYFCAIAENSVGKTFGSVLSFTTPTPPAVTTNAATNIANSSVRLQGTGIANGSAATGWFRYSLTDPGTCNDTFGSRAPATGGSSLGSSTSTVNYYQNVSGLSAGTIYYYCAIASSAEGMAFGAVLSVTTADVPNVTTQAATSVLSNSATLNGSANPNSNGSYGYFRYSASNPGACNDSFGTRAPSSSSSDTYLGEGDTSVSFGRSIGGLLPGTTYFYCALGRNSYGTSFGAVLSFSTPAALPTISTSSAINVLTDGATLRGNGNPGGDAAVGWFRYGTASPGACNDSFGTRAPTVSGSALGSGTSNVSFSQIISGLAANTTYYYCAIGSNAVGTSFGNVLSFTTTSPPTVNTLAATPVTATTATLNASVNPNGYSTTGWFRYSITDPGACDTSFGTSTATSNLGSGSTAVALASPLTGLSPATTYYFCAIANSSTGMTLGAVLSFTTPAAPPSVTTNTATLVLETSATLNGTSNPNGSTTTGWFRYSTVDPGTCNDAFGTRAPTSGGADLGDGNAPVNFSLSISGLSAQTTYYYCALGSSGVGNSVGQVLSFTTPGTATVTTVAASAIATTLATLNGSADPNLSDTTGWFRYSTTNPGTCNDTFGTRAPTTGGAALGAGTNAVPYSQALTGLSPATTYYFCAIAQSAVSTEFGAVLSFTTTAAPSVTSVNASAITNTSATLNGSANPNLSTASGWFRFSTTDPGACNDTFGTRSPTSGGTALGAGSTPIAYNRTITGLAAATTYYFCAIAQNSSGTGFGSVLSFTTPSAPTVASLATSSVGTTSATLNGTANPNLSAATGWFRYSASNPGSCNDSFGTRAPTTGGTALGAGSSPLPFSEVLSGLSPATTYYFCAIADNAIGKSFGALLSFTTTAPPAVTTLAAGSVTSTTATLNGSANPNLSATTGWYRYSTSDPGSCNDTFGTRAPTTGGTALGAGSSALPFSEALSGLSSNTTYYFCAIAQNAIGTSVGAVLSFTTPDGPNVTSLAATNVATASATLNGSADPNLSATTGWFRFSSTDPGACDDSFGTRTPTTGGTALGAGTNDVPFTQALSGLTPATTYYFCAIAENATSKAFGAVLSFTTTAAPTVTSLAATSVTSGTATLNGSANPNLDAASGWFRYSGTDPGSCNDSFGTRAPTSGGTALGAGSTAVPYSEPLSGLSAGTTYYFCAIAGNGVGVSVGAVMSFTTTEVPVVTTLAATGVASTSATLNGSANPNLDATTGRFRYSTTDPGSCNDSFGTPAPATGGTALGAGMAAVPFSEALTGLSAGTTYYFCAIADNSVGSGLGAVMSFTTAAAPTVTTLTASSVTSTTATLNGSANPNLSATTGWYRYSTSDPGACNDSFGTRAPTSGGSALGAAASALPYNQPLTGLSGNTTYYFCAIANNAVGTSFGSVLSFTTPDAPTVATLAATNVANTSATLNAVADPNLSATIGWFRYSASDPGSCNDSFGTRAPTSGGTALGAGTSNVPFAQGISGLSPATTYYFCAIAENTASKAFGAVLSFTTTDAPAVTTLAATNLDNDTATLNGSANPNLAAASGWFRFSATDPGSCNDTFGTRAPTSGGTALGAGSSVLPYSEALSGLSAGTTYYFCAIASNSAGISFGTLLSFTTTAVPSVTTVAETNVTSTAATLNGSANPNLDAATGRFRYSTTDPGSCNDTFGTAAPATGGTALGAGSSTVPFSEALTGLSAGTTYYFCAIADNSVGSGFGAVLSFTTPDVPAVTTGLALAGSSGATLNGAANPNLSDSSGWFRYDVTDPGICDDSFGTRAPTTGGTALGAGSNSQPFMQIVSGLLPTTTYYYCAIAENAVGTSFGAVMSFTTSGAPLVTTEPASNVTSATANFNGTADPNLLSTTGWFRYDTSDPGSCDDSFGTRAPATGGTDVGAGNVAAPFFEAITGLAPGTTYYYCAIAENADGVSFGSVVTMTAAPAAPTVLTNPASNVDTTSAELNGAANPNGADATAWFRYDTVDPGSCNNTFGASVPVGGSAIGNGVAAVNYQEQLTDLSPGVTYYYCAIAENTEGISFGEIASFMTGADAPSVTTTDVSEIGSTSAIISGTANPNGTETQGWLRYGTFNPGTCDNTFGTQVPEGTGVALGSGLEPAAFAREITDLEPFTTYYYCAAADNLGGASFGEVLSFTTIGPPQVATLPATVTGANVTLNGEAIPEGSTAIAWFRYATSEPAECDDSFGTRLPGLDGTDLGDGTEGVSFSESLADLAPDTYFYCAIAESDGGIGFGEVVSFTVIQPGSSEPPPLDDGCGCRVVSGGNNPSAAWLLTLLGFVLIRRRRARAQRARRAD